MPKKKQCQGSVITSTLLRADTFSGFLIKFSRLLTVDLDLCSIEPISTMAAFTNQVGKLPQSTQTFINNEWADSKSGQSFATVNPRTEEVIATVQAGHRRC